MKTYIDDLKKEMKQKKTKYSLSKSFSGWKEYIKENTEIIKLSSYYPLSGAQDVGNKIPTANKNLNHVLYSQTFKLEGWGGSKNLFGFAVGVRYSAAMRLIFYGIFQDTPAEFVWRHQKAAMWVQSGAVNFGTLKPHIKLRLPDISEVKITKLFLTNLRLESRRSAGALPLHPSP